jgi:hypothetical protein
MNSPEMIDRYILDELTLSEQMEFEKEMQDNEELGNDLELMRHIAVAFQRKGEKNLLQEKMPFARYRKTLITVLSAAAVILLVYTGIQPEYTSEQLFVAYFDNTDFETVPCRDGKSPEEIQNEQLFSRAVRGIHQDNIQESIDLLHRLSQSSVAFEYKEEAEWALALAYLKNDQRKEAQTILNKIVEYDDYYSVKARELTEKLKSRRWF